jgi:hypothetical protein
MLFDNSSGHTCRLPTALNVNMMGLGPGGMRQGKALPDMHPTVWDGKDNADNVLNQEWANRDAVGRQQEIKRLGLKAILQQRGLMTDEQRPTIVWNEDAACWEAAPEDAPEMDTDAARKMLAKCSDFADEPYEVQMIYGGPNHYGKRKHIGSFLAKFHPGAHATPQYLD